MPDQAGRETTPRETPCTCCGKPVAEARPPYCPDCHDKECP